MIPSHRALSALASRQMEIEDKTAAYKTDFVNLMIEAGVLTFGDFVTKSGRATPYFINTGRYRTGDQIRRLGRCYADAIVDRIGLDFDVLFGPAYKGIPLAVTTAVALSERGCDVAYCFNRKERKDHGEGGVLVGHELVDGDRVLIIEDITTAGTAVSEAIPLLRTAADITLAGLVVSVDRRERASEHEDAMSALDTLADRFDMPAVAIVDVFDILSSVPLDDEQRSAMLAYLNRYGPN